jgi:hypothetical protein
VVVAKTIRCAMAVLFASGLGLHAQSSAPPKLTLCLTPVIPLSAPVLGLLADELRQYGPALQREIVLDCKADSAVPVMLDARPTGTTPPEALGSVKMRDGQILPGIRVYFNSVNDLLPVHSPRNLARGAALVIAHECRHYLLQTAGHKDGVGGYAFSGTDLARGVKWWNRRTID